MTKARHLLICLIVTMTLIGGIVATLKMTEKAPVSSLEQLQNNLPISVPVTPSTITELPKLVQEINARNSQIVSIGCDDVELKIWEGGHRVKLKGQIYSEKPNNFRLRISSIMGKELDIGSNPDFLWYWSRRDKEPGLHYAAHVDFEKTRLKSPFDPLFLRSTLGIELLSEDGVSLTDTENEFIMTYSKKDSRGLPIQFSVFVSKSRKQIEGYIIRDLDGKIEASCEIQQYVGEMPTQILYNWYAEGRVMLMLLNRPKLNPIIGPEMWAMPNHVPKLNMATD